MLTGDPFADINLNNIDENYIDIFNYSRSGAVSRDVSILTTDDNVCIIVVISKYVLIYKHDT